HNTVAPTAPASPTEKPIVLTVAIARADSRASCPTELHRLCGQFASTVLDFSCSARKPVTALATRPPTSIPPAKYASVRVVEPPLARGGAVVAAGGEGEGAGAGADADFGDSSH